MDTLTRWLVLGVLPLIGVLYVGGLAVRPVPSAELLAAPRISTGACTQPPVFKPGYQRRDGFVTVRGEGFKFDSDAWIEAPVCSTGTLSITANGDLAGDELPQLLVVLGSTVIATPRFDQERTVKVRIPQPGQVYLAFFNDYYLADVRVATLRDVQLKAPNCQGFKKVDVPVASAGTWSPGGRTATLVRAMPMTLIPCAAGTLTMQLQGREGNGAFPALAFEQAGTLLTMRRTDLNWQSIELSVKASPMTITVSNPYGKTLADRNLNVQRLMFAADPSLWASQP